MTEERRAWPRVQYAHGILPPATMVQPGREVIVVNLSRGGALVESTWRFRPGSRLTLDLHADAAVVQAAGEVDRCFVHAIERGGAVRYRTVIRFEVPLTIEPPVEVLELDG